MGVIEIHEPDDHVVVLKCRNKQATFSQLGNTLPAMLEQAYNWGYRDGEADFIADPDPTIIDEINRRGHGCR